MKIKILYIEFVIHTYCLQSESDRIIQDVVNYDKNNNKRYKPTGNSHKDGADIQRCRQGPGRALVITCLIVLPPDGEKDYVHKAL